MRSEEVNPLISMLAMMFAPFAFIAMMLSPLFVLAIFGLIGLAANALVSHPPALLLYLVCVIWYTTSK